MGGGDQAHIDLHGGVAAHRLEGPLLDDAQELGLGGRGQLGNLVEEQGPPIRRLEPTVSLPLGACERAPLVAEQLCLDEGLGQGTAVHRHERSVAARPPVVEHAGDQLLASPAFARDHRGGIRLGDGLDQREEATHGRRLTDQQRLGLLIRQGGARLVQLGTQTANRSDTLQAVKQVVGLEGLRQIVVRANAAHPYESPTPLTDFILILAETLIAASLTYTFGKMVGDTRQGWAILAAMLMVLALFVVGAYLGRVRRKSTPDCLGCRADRRECARWQHGREGSSFRGGSFSALCHRDDGDIHRSGKFDA